MILNLRNKDIVINIGGDSSILMNNGKTVEITLVKDKEYLITYQSPGGGVGSTFILETSEEYLAENIKIFIRELCRSQRIEIAN